LGLRKEYSMNGYEINVAVKNKRGHWCHLFATDPRSCPDEKAAERLYELFKEKFPEPDYDISVTRLETIGHHVEF